MIRLATIFVLLLATLPLFCDAFPWLFMFSKHFPKRWKIIKTVPAMFINISGRLKTKCPLYNICKATEGSRGSGFCLFSLLAPHPHCLRSATIHVCELYQPKQY